MAKVRRYNKGGVGGEIVLRPVNTSEGPVASTTFMDENEIGDVMCGRSMTHWSPAVKPINELSNDYNSDVRGQKFYDRRTGRVVNLAELELSREHQFAVLQENKVQTAWLGDMRMDIMKDGVNLYIKDTMTDCNMVVGVIDEDTGRAVVEYTVNHYSVAYVGNKDPICRMSSLLAAARGGRPYELVVRLTTRPGGVYSWVFFWASQAKTAYNGVPTTPLSSP